MLYAAKRMRGQANHHGGLLQVTLHAVVALPCCLQQLALLMRQPILHTGPEVTLPGHPMLQLLPAA
jgi:hypothetical protein